jgi:phage FluMu protein Com
MGGMVIAKCSCGYSSEELYLGGGMINFDSNCSIPFYCDNCDVVYAANILSEYGLKNEHKCPKCNRVAYYYGEIKDNHIDFSEKSVFDWLVNDNSTYFLSDSIYHCPKCKKENMKFLSLGCWD